MSGARKDGAGSTDAPSKALRMAEAAAEVGEDLGIEAPRTGDDQTECAPHAKDVGFCVTHGGHFLSGICNLAPRTETPRAPSAEDFSSEPEIVAKAMAACSRLVHRAHGSAERQHDYAKWPRYEADVDDIADALTDLGRRIREGDVPAQALAALVKDGGALVSSNDCSVMEITAARACGRFFVTPDALGFVRRPKEWVAHVTQEPVRPTATAEETELRTLRRELQRLHWLRDTVGVDIERMFARAQKEKDGREQPSWLTGDQEDLPRVAREWAHDSGIRDEALIADLAVLLEETRTIALQQDEAHTCQRSDCNRRVPGPESFYCEEHLPDEQPDTDSSSTAHDLAPEHVDRIRAVSFGWEMRDCNPAGHNFENKLFELLVEVRTEERETCIQIAKDTHVVGVEIANRIRQFAPKGGM
jgi:hypothetical protein